MHEVNPQGKSPSTIEEHLDLLFHDAIMRSRQLKAVAARLGIAAPPQDCNEDARPAREGVLWKLTDLLRLSQEDKATLSQIEEILPIHQTKATFCSEPIRNEQCVRPEQPEHREEGGPRRQLERAILNLHKEFDRRLRPIEERFAQL